MTVNLVTTRHGRFICQDNDMYIGRSLVEYGEYSEAEVSFLLQVARPGDTVIEGGANIGTITVPLARRVGPTGRVIAFEPQRLVFQTLCGNLAMNGIENVHARHAALGSIPGQTTIPFVSYGQAVNYGSLRIGCEGGETVPVVTIDSLELPRLDLLMADVEGCEEDLLRGAVESIARHKPNLYLENNQRGNSSSLLSLLFSLGYEAWWHLPPLFRPDNFNGKSTDIFGKRISINIICQHPDRMRPVAGLRKIAGLDDWWQRD